MQLALRPAPQVHFSVPTRRSDDATAFGGIAVVTIAAPGIWSIGLGGAAWIEVVQDGKAVPSSAHSHGDGCITKTVVFPLKPGRATIELSSSSQQSVRVVAKPAN